MYASLRTGGVCQVLAHDLNFNQRTRWITYNHLKVVEGNEAGEFREHALRGATHHTDSHIHTFILSKSRACGTRVAYVYLHE
jgi:hypothetical protein